MCVCMCVCVMCAYYVGTCACVYVCYEQRIFISFALRLVCTALLIVLRSFPVNLQAWLSASLYVGGLIYHYSTSLEDSTKNQLT